MGNNNGIERTQFIQGKIEEITDFSKSIDSDLDVLQVHIQALQQKISDKLYVEETKEGVLRRTLSTYTSCFRAQVSRLKRLVAEDMDEWKGELRGEKPKVHQEIRVEEKDPNVILKGMLNAIIYKRKVDMRISRQGSDQIQIIKDLIPYTKGIDSIPTDKSKTETAPDT